MAARRRAPPETVEVTAPTRTRKPRERAIPREIRDSVMADDGGLYVMTLGSRIVLDVLAYQDEGLLAFVRVEGEVVAELPVLGQA